MAADGHPGAKPVPPKQAPVMEHLRLWWILAGGIVLALVFFATDHMWRATGSLVATLLVCAVLRVVSPPEVAGGLVVRRPWIDVASLVLLAAVVGVVGFNLDLTALR
jgi:hypothetical protein